MKKVRTIYLTVRVDVEADTELTDSDIVSELDYEFSSFDDKVEVRDTEICDINQ